jgi:hypothetical protein
MANQLVASLTSFIQSVSFHIQHPVKMINFCTGESVKRRNMPLTVRMGLETTKESHRSSPWYQNNPGEYPTSKSFEDWGLQNGVYEESDYWSDYDLDFD